MNIKTKLGNIAADYINCGATSPLVVIVHARGSHRNSNSKIIAEYFQQFDISSLRIDLYGYGESDGKLEDITITTAKESILGVIDYVKNNLKYSKLFIFSSSYGASGTLSAIPSLSPNDISGLIFRSPILNYLEKTKREFSEEEIQSWKENGYVTDFEGRLNYSFVEDMKSHIPLNYLEITKYRILFFHGGLDSKVLISEIEELNSHFKENFELIVYPNAEHGFSKGKDFEDMLDKTKEFILS